MDHLRSGETAPQADRCTLFLEIQKESRKHVSHKAIANSHQKASEIGSRDALGLPVRLFALAPNHAKRGEQRRIMLPGIYKYLGA
jgi:hypothetical protein